MKHFVALTALLALVVGAHVKIRSDQVQAAQAHAPQTEIALPTNIADYRIVGDDIEVEEKVRALLETSALLIRNYANAARWPVQLTIVYAGTTRRSLHFPEVCLVGNGWEIREKNDAPVGVLLTAKRLMLVKGDQRQAVIYWFKTGDTLTGNYFLNAFYWARNLMAAGTATSAMIKVATPVGPQGEEAAFALLEDFAAKATPVILDTVQ